eukprot:scaffold69559_cov54-Phaeocystis_antarctica.AAC.4
MALSMRLSMMAVLDGARGGSEGSSTSAWAGAPPAASQEAIVVIESIEPLDVLDGAPGGSEGGGDSDGAGAPVSLEPGSSVER